MSGGNDDKDMSFSMAQKYWSFLSRTIPEPPKSHVIGLNFLDYSQKKL
jgi:hypothetical protein